MNVHEIDISSQQSPTQFSANSPPRLQDWNDTSVGMTGHRLRLPPNRGVVGKELDYGPNTALGLRGPDVKHRTHRFPLGRLTTHLSNEGLAVAVLDGVLIVGPIRRLAGEVDD